MERKQYLKKCQTAAIVGRDNLTDEHFVIYDGKKYIPVKQVLKYSKNGDSIYTAVLLDKNARYSTIEVDIEKVE